MPSRPDAAGTAPLVTVATVVLNAAGDLPITLESVAAQDLPGVERLVVDGSSWDGTHAVLARYGDVVDRVAVVEDAGIFHAMNEAARLARGTFIHFMNAGDRFHGAGSLRTLMEGMPDGADVVFGDHVYRSGGVEEFRPARDFGVQVELLRTGAIDGRWLARFPAHQATATRTALLRRLGYDTALRVCADHDFLLRAAWDGARIAYVDDIVAEYAGGGFSARHGDLLRLEFNAVYRAFCERPETVDRLLYGDGSPFGGQRSPFAGGFVSGFSPARAETPGIPCDGPHRLLHAAGGRLAAPAHAGATGLRLAGFNPGAPRSLAVLDCGVTVGSATVPAGTFAVDVPFDRRCAPRAVLAVAVGGEGVVVEGVPVALAVGGLMFRGAPRGDALPRGARLQVSDGMERDLAAIFAGGWWAPEAGHAWSTARGELAVPTEAGVRALRLTVAGNPSVDGQRLLVEVNGTQLAEAPVGGSPTLVEADVADVWRHDGTDNAVTLVPSAAVSAGADPRALGVALIAIELA